jgi:16S rRNA (guanine(966)-N(2))-methyltransferase RsmD
VIAGKLRGRHLKSVPKDYKSVRPISGRIKKSLFDILFHLVPGSRFLDMFAGTGAVGMEALSREASFVFFVDRDERCVNVITENIKAAGFAGKAKAHMGNALSELTWIPFRSGVEQFDLVFLGPPYKDDEAKPLALSTPALARLAQSGLLAPKAVVVVQHHLKEDVSEPEGLPRFRRERYGDTYLDFHRWK